MAQSFARGWYAILPIIEIKNKPLAIMRFGINLVVWRDNKQNIIVMEDSCPHRSAKLSLGKICDGQISCPFHAFKFATDGSCSYAPEFDKAIPGLKVKTFEAKVAVGILWFNFGDVSEPIKLERLLNLDADFNATYSITSKSWSSHITRCIENQLDYTHLPVVHHNTIGRGFKIPTNPKFVKDSAGIKSFHRDKIEEPSSEYIFPNAWILNISDKMKLVVYFVPVTEGETKFYIFTYRKFLANKVLKPLVDLLMNYSNKIILKQDQKVVESQGETPSFLAKNELLMRHDTPIRMFRELWEENLH